MNKDLMKQSYAYRLLHSIGYRLVDGFRFKKPTPDHVVTFTEQCCIDNLVKFHNFGGILCDSHTDVAGEKPMTLHASTHQYLQPTDQQKRDMEIVRTAAAAYTDAIESIVPDGSDKTYLLRKFREVAMWANISITRNPDGTPRT